MDVHRLHWLVDGGPALNRVSIRLAKWVGMVAIAAASLTARLHAADSEAPVAAKTSPDEKSAAEKPEQPPVAEEPGKATVASVTATLKQLDAADADSPDRAKLIEIYRQAIDDLKDAHDKQARIAELEAKRIAVPYQLQTRKRDPVPTAKPPATLPADAALAKWDEMLDAAEQESEQAQKLVAAKDDELERRAARRVEIPQEIAAARMKLDALAQEDSGSDAAGDSAAIVAAWKTGREAHTRQLEAEIALLEKELQCDDAASEELLKLDRDAAAAKVDEIGQRVAAWREAVNSRRKTEADREAATAHWAAATAEPAVRKLADENSALADERRQLADQLEHLAGRKETVAARLEKIRDQHNSATEKAKVAGLTDAIGQMLLKQRSALAALEADRREVRSRQLEISRVQSQLFDFQQRLAGLRDLDARVKEYVAELPPGSEAKPADLRSILKTQQKYLEELVTDYDSYFGDLVELDSTQRGLLTEADQFTDFIDECVLWIRSTHSLSLGDIKQAGPAAAWLVAPTHLQEVAASIAQRVRNNVALVAISSGVLIGWFFSLRRLKSWIKSWARQPASDSSPNESLVRAIKTTVVTLCVAAFWPAALWSAGWLVASLSADREFSIALGTALQTVALALLPILFARQICRKDGLGEAHFRWPAGALADLRRRLGWLTVAGMPVVLMVALLEVQSNDAWKDSLGRLLFIACQLVLLPFLFRALRPQQGPLYQLMAIRRESWTAKLSTLIFFAVLGIPIVLAIMAAAGYYYTALRLTSRVEATLWLLLGLVIIQAIASRWLTAVYRRLAIAAITRNFEKSQAVRGHALPAATGETSTDEDEAEARPDIDLEKIDVQTHRLLQSTAILALVVGLCFVWADLFPAFRFFDRIVLWPDPGVDAAHSSNVTLLNLLEAIAIGVMTLIAAVNLPSLLELAVLERLPLDNGVRYAVLAVTRYSIAFVGIVLAGGSVGIGWPKLQWLAAAISFGLGFGLQEIFANFVSGIIVLVERPIRIGDTVTVGDMTGVVARIRMRATTIVDGDRKELIVPNKEFITSKLVNWTLTDSVTRLVVPLGVAYGAEPQKVQRLLMRIAGETPTVLRNPPPKAVFMGFGEKTLNFELRVFVGEVDVLMSTRHQLNMAIDQAFRTAGIDIAVAQRENAARLLGAASNSAARQEKAA